MGVGTAGIQHLAAGTRWCVNCANNLDPTTIPAEALQVGGGYFWLLQFDPTQDQIYHFGMTDESGKLNLKAATAAQGN